MNLIEQILSEKWWEWVFSGAGNYILGGFVSLLTFCFVKNKYFSQKTENNRAGRNVNRMAGDGNKGMVVQDLKGDVHVHMNSPSNTQSDSSIDKKKPKILGETPVRSETFLGRDEDLKAVHERLFRNDSNLLLLVNGIGGIGKTTLASHYYHKYSGEYEYLIWIAVTSGILEDAFDNIAQALQLNIDSRFRRAERLNSTIAALLDLDRPCLLVLDNANEELEKYYPLLRKLSGIHIIVTTRVADLSKAETYRVGRLSKKKAAELFNVYCPVSSHDDELLEKILVAIDYHTLTIEILSKSLAEKNRIKKRYSLSQLNEDLHQCGVLQLKIHNGLQTDYHEKAPPEKILESMYDISELSEGETFLLSVLSVLPAQNILFDHLENILTSSDSLENSVRSLSRKGWIECEHLSSILPDHDGTILKINPVVQEIVRKQNKARLTDDTQGLVSGLNDRLDYVASTGVLISSKYLEGVEYVRYAETVCSRLRLVGAGCNVLNLYERLGSYFTSYGNLEKALKYFKESSRLGASLCEYDPNNQTIKYMLAISYSKMGTTHTALGNLEKALKYFEESSRLGVSLHEADPKNQEFKNGLAMSYQKLGEIYTDLGNLEKALSFLRKRFQLGEELYKANPKSVGFKNGWAISYEKMGEIYIALGNLKNALKYFEKDAQLTREINEVDPENVEFRYGLATSYQKLGETHTALGNLEKALEYFERCYELGKELYETDPENVRFKSGMAISYRKLGETHAIFDNLENALKYFEKENDLFEELYEVDPKNVGFKNGLAISYSKLGRIHTILDNLEKALKYFEKGNEFAEELYEVDLKNVNFKNGLAISYEKLGETHTALGNLEKALKYFEKGIRLEKELYEADSKNVKFKNGLAISHDKLGETHAALGCLEKALKYFKEENELFKELYKTDPKNVGFKNGRAVSHYKLGTFYIEHTKDIKSGLLHFKNAQAIWKDLTNRSPAYVKFIKNYNAVTEDISHLNEKSS
ncbi:MAG: hypothetical protein D3925_01940 [Candidatus Electrothrix sp. AR5]|nr:hypothetical protein [Candidatus Electrothrix sp. AR5]